jgi:chromosomal replication initiator protein
MEAWEKARTWIREKLSEQVFETWFSPVSLVEITDDDRFVLSVPNNFFKEWLSNNYVDLLQEAMLVETGKKLKVVFQVAEGSAVELLDTPLRTESQPTIYFGTSRLNPKYTFSSFVVGSSNQLPAAASVAVSNATGLKYNPLFIYGGVGLGKTHLLHAIGNGVRANAAGSRICYISTEEFMNEFVSSLRTNKMEQFRRRFRKDLDVLLMDDIQFIGGKESTQDEFFHTFNSLYEDNKQIVLTSDKYPQEIPDLEERLRSRFQWGLIADIQPPELETRLAILNKKAEDENIPLPNDVALFLASSIKSNVRELEGSLINLAAHASLENRRIDISFARETLKKVIALHQNTLSVENVQQTVCKHFNVSLNDLRGPRRHRSVAFPRQVAMYLCRKVLNSSYPELGLQFGGKDHTTALAACRKIERLVAEDVEVRSKIEALERLLQL